MRCPKCGHTDSKVIDSRPSDNQEAIRRRRECLNCAHRFTTYERREESPLIIVKKDNSKEIFNREKLLRGLEMATVKRDIKLEQLNNLITDIELTLKIAYINKYRLILLYTIKSLFFTFTTIFIFIFSYLQVFFL